MHAHHEDTIRRLVATFRDDPRYPALIVGGSIAKGYERPDSDVDILLVATDEEYARRVHAGDLWYFEREAAAYEGGYVDGKVIDLRFLRDAAAHGSEPARSAFAGARVGYTRLPELDDVLRRIPVYPEHERAGKLRAFYSQLALTHLFVPEARTRDDPYLLTWAAGEMVFWGARLLLAHNRYPWRKWLLRALRDAPDKPAKTMDLADRLLRAPSETAADAFWACVASFRDWGVSWDEAVVRFMRDVEWPWREGRASLAES